MPAPRKKGVRRTRSSAHEAERRRAIEDAAELRALFAALTDVILVLDGEGRYLKIAPSGASLLYRPPEELVGKTVHEVFPKEQADFFLASIRRALDSSLPVQIEYSLPIGGKETLFEATLARLDADRAVCVARDVTGRKAAEQALRESEDRFRLLSEAALEGIAISEEGKVVACNSALAAMLGCSLEEMVGRPVADFVAPEHADLVAGRVRAESTERYEHLARCKDGTTLRVEVQGRTLPHQGRKLRVTAIRDVSERRRSELVQTAVFRIAEAALTALSLQELFGAIHRIVGELMPAKNFYIALYDAPHDLISFPYFADEIDEAPSPKKPGRGLTEYVLRTGQPLLGTPEVFDRLVGRGDVELIGAPSIDWLGVPLTVEGTTIGVLVVQSYTEGVRYAESDRNILQFVSAQVAMAIERKRAEEALRDSEERLRALESATTEGVALHADGRMVEVNQAFLRMLGYTDPKEVIGRSVFDFCAPESHDKLQEVMQSGSETPYEAVGLRKDGSKVVGELSGRTAHYRGREVRMTAIRDITARKQLEAQLQQAQKMEAVGRLAGGIAHDFNNLLTAVLASSELLQSALPAQSPLRDDVQTIISAAQRGAELNKRLLAFSRKQPLQLRRISLALLANDFSQLARRVVPEDVEVTVGVGAGEMTVNADPGAIEQMLMNLVTNARDAMPGGGKLVITVERQTVDEGHCRVLGWGTPGEYVTLAVSDTGVGMGADTVRRIFEPFFTTKPLGQGTGLGMSMVYGLVKEHEGFVQVSSTPDQGTTVRLYFPPVAGTASEAFVMVAPEARGGTETILLVEDDEAVRRAASRVLEKFGYEVLLAADGFGALDILEAGDARPHLIISDVVMPQLSGPHLLSKLREAGLEPRILFTSGYPASEVVDRTQLEPGVPFLAKPWTIPELLRKVREVLDTAAGT